MRSITRVVVAGLLWLGLASVADAGSVQVAIKDGRVSIVAKNATVAEILTEWARVGQVKVENLQAAPREPMTIELTDVSEQRAIATVLRRAGGYIATRRETADADASAFARVLVMAASAPVVRPGAQAASAAAVPDAANVAQTDQGDPEQAAAYLIAAGQADRGAAGLPTVDQGADPRGGDQAPARDRVIPPDPTPPSAMQPVGMMPVDDNPIIPGTVDDIPPLDPRAQEAFKRRQAVEVADPRKFNFTKPPAPAKQPGGR